MERLGPLTTSAPGSDRVLAEAFRYLEEDHLVSKIATAGRQKDNPMDEWSAAGVWRKIAS